MNPNQPPLVAKPARDREIELAVALSAALAVTVSVPVGIAFGVASLAHRLKSKNLTLSANEVARLALVALGAIVLAQLIKDWPDAKQGFLDGWRASTGWR